MRKTTTVSEIASSPEHTPKEFFQIETDLNAIMEYTHMLEQFYPDKVIQICRQHHEAAFYVSENCKDFWGIPAKRMNFITMDEYLDLVHPEDLGGLSGVQQLIKEHSTGQDPTQLRFTLVYRMKGPDGQYHTIEDEKIVLRTRNGNYAHFSTYTRTTEKVTPTLDIYKMINNRKIKIKSYILGNQPENFSARELDIIKLMDQGYSNAEISTQLSLSIFTVKNHKQRLFRKAQVKSTIELLRFARTQNIL